MRNLSLILLTLASLTLEAFGQTPPKPTCYPPNHSHIEVGKWSAQGATIPSGVGVVWSCASKFGFDLFNLNWRFDEMDGAAANIKTKAAADAAWTVHAWRDASPAEKMWAIDAFSRVRAKAAADAPVFRVAKNGTATTRPTYALVCTEGHCVRASATAAARATVGSTCDCASHVDIASSATQAYCAIPKSSPVLVSLCTR